MSAGAYVNLHAGDTPGDYHCTCTYCKKVIGELAREDGTYYSRLERREYYAPEETRKEDGSGHIAKTPLHIARWAIQQYSQPGDWVLDPTIGAGTTAVEALTQGRSVAGMELEYGNILKANVTKALESQMAISHGAEARVASGDARNIAEFLKTTLPKIKFNLVVNNPPYSGDISAYPKRDRDGKPIENMSYLYNPDLPNIAFLKESDEYWETMERIYEACIERLVPGGHFVIGVKDQTRKGASDLLHKDYCDAMMDLGMSFVGTAFLRHYPGTWHLNRALKENNKAVAQYQTISVFRKP